jgi:hypothetical protein
LVERAPTPDAIRAEQIARIGFLTSLTSAIILVMVMLGNIVIAVFHVSVGGALWLIVQAGPPIAAGAGGVGTASSYYGYWRILRRLERFEVRKEAADKALDILPGQLQQVPHALARRMGCANRFSLLTCVASTIICVLTLGPGPIHVLGAALAPTPTQPPSALATPTPPLAALPTATPSGMTTPTATVQPTATIIPKATSTKSPAPSPTPTIALALTTGANVSQQCPPFAATLTSYPLILDNTRSTVAVSWSMTFDNDPMGNPWATTNPLTGSVPAGQRQSLTITPADPPLCADLPHLGQAFPLHITIHYGANRVLTATDTVTAQDGT